MTYVPALDGLRALAVVAVLLFHGEVGLPGGFLGVSVFFTLSGYLITSLLLSEHAATDAVSLPRFYARRARRLLPASLLCLTVVSLVGPLWTSTQRAHLPGDVWAALGNVANWRFAFGQHTYAELFRADPSPLAHYWSLAIEEQLYLLLPLMVVLSLRRSRTTLLQVTVALTLLSIGAMVTSANRDLAYLATHTRASELLVGSLLAQVGWASLRARSADLVGAAGALGLSVVMATTPVDAAWLYRGGLVAVALASAGVITAACSGGVVARVLGTPTLTSLGRISYGVYLYHWPIFLLLTPERAGVSGWPLFVLRAGVSLTVAAASSRWIEQPVRQGALVGMRLAVPMVATFAAVAVIAAVAVPAPTFTKTEALVALGDGGPLELTPALGQAADSIVPAGRPGVTRPVVLVVGSDPRAAQALRGTSLRVVNVTNPECPVASGQAALTGYGPLDISGCAPTAGRVGRLVAEYRASVVVLATGPLDRWQVRLASQPGFAVDTDWAEVDQRWRHVRADLQAGVDAAVASGAAVILSDAGPPQGLDHDLFDDQLGSVALTSTSLSATTRTPEALRTAVQAASVAASAQPGGRLRVLVIGDSTSLTLARALGDAAPDRLAVVWGGQNGCPIVRLEATRRSASAPWVSNECEPFDRSLPPLLARYHPDVVLVAAVLAEVSEQRYPGDPTPHVAGDPAFTAVHDRDFRELAAIVTATGASVVVADTPAIRSGVFASVQMSGRARLAAWNAQIARWPAQDPRVGVLGLAAAIGDYEAAWGNIRTDGVHPDLEPLTELAHQRLVGELLAIVNRSVPAPAPMTDSTLPFT